MWDRPRFSRNRRLNALRYFDGKLVWTNGLRSRCKLKFNNVVIEDYGYYLPEEYLSSAQLEEMLSPLYKRLKLPEGRLELMTGIEKRGIWANGTLPSSLSTKAIENLLNKGNVDKFEVDMLINSSVCRDFLEPSTASIIHGNIGFKNNTTIFDLSNACLGMVNAWVVIASMIEQGLIKRAIVVSGENAGPLLTATINELNTNTDITRKSLKKYFANLTIGSAAVAYSLCHCDLCPTGHQLLGGATMTDSSANKLCTGDGDPNSLVMETDSEELLKYGKSLAKKSWEESKKHHGLSENEIDLVIGHQVGKAHKEIVLKNLGLQDRPTFDTFHELGNTGSSALPITLALKNDREKIKKESNIALIGIGSGLSSISMGVKW